MMIEAYLNMNQPVTMVSKTLNRSRQTIYNVYNFLKQGKSICDYFQQYKENKARCGRHPIHLPTEQQDYIQTMVAQGWTPNVIIGRAYVPISCSVRTLHRMFHDRIFNLENLPMKGKRKPNGHKETRGKQAFRRSIRDRKIDYTQFDHLEDDTIVDGKHKSAVITLVERLSKVIITLKPEGRQAKDIENRLNQ